MDFHRLPPLAITLCSSNRADAHIRQLHQRVTRGIRHLYVSDARSQFPSQVGSEASLKLSTSTSVHANPRPLQTTCAVCHEHPGEVFVEAIRVFSQLLATECFFANDQRVHCEWTVRDTLKECITQLVAALTELEL